MALKISRRGLAVPGFLALKILADAREMQAKGADVVGMSAGQPAKGAPERVLRYAAEALLKEPMGYTEALGLPALRESIAAYYERKYNEKVDMRRIVVTTGSSGAFIMSFLSAFDAGDKIAMAAPCYPAYRNILYALDLVPVELPSSFEEKFQPTVERLEALPEKPAGLIIASPSNPAGTMLGKDELKKLADYCKKHGIRIISDEIYHGVTYGRDGVSLLSVTDQAVVVNSFSKYFSCTGWRLGWMVVPEDMVDVSVAMAQNLFISPPTLSQHVGIASLADTSEVDEYVKEYKRSRDLLFAELPKCGFGQLSQVEGGFYIYADVGNLTNDSISFCQQMLNDIQVAITPGVDFDPARGSRTVRISFAGSYESVEKAVERMRGWRR